VPVVQRTSSRPESEPTERREREGGCELHRESSPRDPPLWGQSGVGCVASARSRRFLPVSPTSFRKKSEGVCRLRGARRLSLKPDTRHAVSPEGGGRPVQQL
jgi:hypothetical protein